MVLRLVAALEREDPAEVALHAHDDPPLLGRDDQGLLGAVVVVVLPLRVVVVDQHLQGAVAIEVYGRALDYDPTCDPIVRSEAHRLRAKLDAYYAGEGASEPIVIRMPRGSYIPEIEPGGTDPDVPDACARILVTPFEDRSPGGGEDALARATGDAVRDPLAETPGLEVVNRALGGPAHPDPTRSEDGLEAPS